MDNYKAAFPFTLEQAARDGFGACAWSAKGTSKAVWMSRLDDGGFEALLSGAKGLILGVKWRQAGLDGAPKFALGKAWGPGAHALDASGLEGDARSARVMDLLGGVALGLTESATVTWLNLQKMKQASPSVSALGKELGEDAWADWSKARRRVELGGMGDDAPSAARRPSHG